MTSQISTEQGAVTALLEKLKDELEDIDDRRAAIKGSIQKAQVELHTTGKYADADWFRRANGALRHLGVARNEVAREIGETSRKLRAINALTNRETFHRAVRDVVDDPTWQLIIQRHEDLKTTQGV